MGELPFHTGRADKTRELTAGDLWGVRLTLMPNSGRTEAAFARPSLELLEPHPPRGAACLLTATTRLSSLARRHVQSHRAVQYDHLRRMQSSTTDRSSMP